MKRPRSALGGLVFPAPLQTAGASVHRCRWVLRTLWQLGGWLGKGGETMERLLTQLLPGRALPEAKGCAPRLWSGHLVTLCSL